VGDYNTNLDNSNNNTTPKSKEEDNITTILSKVIYKVPLST